MDGGGILLNKKINKIFFIYNFKILLKPYNFYYKNFVLSFILPIFALKEKYWFFLKGCFTP